MIYILFYEQQLAIFDLYNLYYLLHKIHRDENRVLIILVKRDFFLGERNFPDMSVYVLQIIGEP